MGEVGDAICSQTNVLFHHCNIDVLPKLVGTFISCYSVSAPLCR